MQTDLRKMERFQLTKLPQNTIKKENMQILRKQQINGHECFINGQKLEIILKLLGV